MNLIEAGVRPKKTQLLANGADSRVYKVGKHVVKVYDSLSARQLADYKKLTDFAAGLFEDNPSIGTLAFEGDTWDFRVSILPIIGVNLQSPVMSISEHVPGPRLYTSGPITREHYLNEVADTCEREFLSKLHELHFFPVKNDSHPLAAFGITRAVVDRINSAIDLGGLERISTQNVKTRANIDQKQVNLIVTDVGNRISSIRYPSWF